MVPILRNWCISKGYEVHGLGEARWLQDFRSPAGQGSRVSLDKIKLHVDRGKVSRALSNSSKVRPDECTHLAAQRLVQPTPSTDEFRP